MYTREQYVVFESLCFMNFVPPTNDLTGPGKSSSPYIQSSQSLGKGDSVSKSDSPTSQTQTALNTLSMKMQADALTEETVKTFLNQYKFGSNLNDDSLALNIMLSMNDVSLGNLASEVIISLRSVFGISDAQIDVQLISMVSRLIHLVGRDDASKTGKQDLHLQ